MSDKVDIAKGMFRAFADADRGYAERHLSDRLEFHSPPDPVLDRAGYFEKCWAGAGNLDSFDFARTVENGDEVIVTYEAKRPDGTRFRNTEVFTFGGIEITRIEVYFGWDLD